MKKIIRRVFLSIAAIIVVAVAALVVGVTHDPDKNVTQPKVTDAAGNTYLAVTGGKDDKETYAVVTGENGSVYAAKIDSEGNIGETVSSLDGQYKASDLPSNYTGPKIDESVNPNDFTGNANNEVTTAPQVPGTNPAPEDTQTSGANQPEGTTASPSENTSSQNSQQDKSYLIQKYQQIFSSGTYLMEFTTNDEALGTSPITAAFKNGNFVIDTQIEEIQCKMLYLAEKDTTYLVLDRFRKYCKLPESLMGDDLDMSSLNMMSGFASGIDDKEITVSTVDLNGQKVTCESYIASDGTTMKYYFSGDTLVRLDNVDKDGLTNSTYISRISSEVPDSMFEIPDNYGFFNLSWLGALGGLGGSSK